MPAASQTSIPLPFWLKVWLCALRISCVSKTFLFTLLVLLLHIFRHTPVDRQLHYVKFPSTLSGVVNFYGSEWYRADAGCSIKLQWW